MLRLHTDGGSSAGGLLRVEGDLGAMSAPHCDDAAADIFRAPKHPYTKALLSSVLSGEVNIGRLVVEGEIPSPMAIPPGCRFHTRCPHAKANCRTQEPSFRKLETDQFAACHYPLE